MKLTIEKLTATTFTGLYESIWLNSDSFENEAYYLEQDGLSEKQMNDAIDSFNTKEYLNEIGKEYVWVIQRELKCALGVDIKLQFTGTWSPREYNFHTDCIYFDMEVESIVEFTANLTRKLLEDPDYYQSRMNEDLKSRSGFSSFYNDDRSLNKWIEQIEANIAGFDPVKMSLLVGYILDYDYNSLDGFDHMAYDELRGNGLGLRDFMKIPELAG